MLSPTLSWEKVGQSRVGNPFVEKSSSGDGSYTLYYSASSVHLDDSDIVEPLYIGMATSSDMEGKFTRLSDEPVQFDFDDSTTMGIGSIKRLEGDYFLINRVTKNEETGKLARENLSVASLSTRFVGSTKIRHVVQKTSDGRISIEKRYPAILASTQRLSYSTLSHMQDTAPYDAV